MQFDGKEVIIMGQATCDICGIRYEGDPMQVHVNLKKHNELIEHCGYESVNDVIVEIVSHDFADFVEEFTT